MWIIAMGLLGCGGTGDAPTTSLTWHADVAPIVEQRCAGCHTDGSFAPFALTSYDEVAALSVVVEAAVRSGAMPPWKPVDGCADYEEDFDLTDEERATLLEWLGGGVPEGDPADAPPLVEPVEDGFRVDARYVLPEAYTPSIEPDDYRCQIIDPGLTAPTWVTGVRVEPDQQAIVHHTIVFVAPADSVDAYRAFDEAAEGPGYPCFGGPTGGSGDPDAIREWFESLTPSQIAQLLQGQRPDGVELPTSLAGLGASWLGSWVPGAPNGPFPEGTGIRLNAGDQLVVQMHYNTLSSDPVADQSAVTLMLADEVDQPAVLMPFTDLGWVTGVDLLGGTMAIPAGDPLVTVTTEGAGDGVIIRGIRRRLGVADDADLLIHSTGLHMHQLGRAGSLDVIHADGTESCLLGIDDWDFAWQGGYRLTEPVALTTADAVRLSCTWDNSPENQPIVDGAAQEPRDVAWGEGTTDEMCLGTLYVTAR